MADFYALPPAEQAQRLAKAAKAALPQWDIDPRAEVTLIKHRENAVFSLAEGGERFAMRVHRANYHSDAELASELQWTAALNAAGIRAPQRSEEHTSELQSLMRISYAVFCLKKQKQDHQQNNTR